MARLLTSNGNVKLFPSNAGSEGGLYSFKAQGTFGGGTLTLAFSLDGGTTLTDYDGEIGALTDNGGFSVNIAKGDDAYIVLTGATSPSISVEVLPIPNRL